jgi:serine/threonine protein kinase
MINQQFPNAICLRELGRGKGGIVIETKLHYQCDCVDEAGIDDCRNANENENDEQCQTTEEEPSIAIKVAKRSFPPRSEEKVTSILTTYLGQSDVLCIPSNVVNHFAYSLFIMPVYEFGNIKEVKERIGSLRSVQLNAISVQVLRALIELEKCDIIHMDIKPDNILVESLNPLRIRLADFDRCIVRDKQEKSYYKCSDGTPIFMPPEIFSLRNANQLIEATTASSVWSLGVVLSEIATNHCAFIKTFQDLARFFTSVKEKASLQRVLEELQEQAVGMSQQTECTEYSSSENFRHITNAGWKEFWSFVDSLVVFEAERRPSLKEITSSHWISDFIISERHRSKR